MGIDKAKLLSELKNSFDSLRNECGFKTTYEDLQDLIFMEDFVLEEGYVSTSLLDELVNKLAERFYSWVGVLHSFIMPSPSDMISSSESKKFSKADKEEIFNLMKGIMYLTRKSKRILFERDKKAESAVLDELVEFDKSEFSPLMAKYHKKLEDAWNQKS